MSRGAAFVVDLGRVRDGDDSGGAIDGEAAARGVAGEAIGKCATVDVGRVGGDTDRGPVGGAFGDGIGRGIGVGRRRGGDVADGDRKVLRRGGDAVACLRGDGVGVTRRALEIDFRGICDRHHAGVRINLEAAARRVSGQRIGNRVSGGTARRHRDVDRRIDDRAFHHAVGGAVAVDRCRQRIIDRWIGRAGRATEIERLEAKFRGECRCRIVQHDIAGSVQMELRPRDAADGESRNNSSHVYSCAGAEPNLSVIAVRERDLRTRSHLLANCALGVLDNNQSGKGGGRLRARSCEENRQRLKCRSSFRKRPTHERRS